MTICSYDILRRKDKKKKNQKPNTYTDNKKNTQMLYDYHCDLKLGDTKMNTLTDWVVILRLLIERPSSAICGLMLILYVKVLWPFSDAMGLTWFKVKVIYLSLFVSTTTHTTQQNMSSVFNPSSQSAGAAWRSSVGMVTCSVHLMGLVYSNQQPSLTTRLPLHIFK